MTSASRWPADAAWRWRLAGALLAAGLAVAGSQAIYRGAYLTADESSYEFQAYCFRDGCLARPLPPIFPVFEHRMILMREELGWLSRYSPGHALWLLPGAWLGWPRLMTALAAGLSVWFLTGCARRLSVPPVLVLGLLLASPYFLFMSGTLLSHTSAHACWAACLWAYLAWVQTRRRRWALLAGLAWAFLFLIRNYTALLLALPFALHGALTGLAHRRDRTVWAGLALAALAALAGPALNLLYNALTTGHALLSPYHVYNPDETLGFGWRYRFGEYGAYTWRTGARHLADSLRLLNVWLWGFPGALLAAGTLWLIGWRRTWSALLGASAAAVWIGYVFFSSRTRDTVGPFYYFETLPSLVLAAALGLWRLAGWSRRLPPAVRRTAAAAGGAALAVTLGGFVWSEGLGLRQWLDTDAWYREVLRAAPPGALIIQQGVPLWQEPQYNPRGLRSDPLVICDFGDAVSLAAAKCFPERTPYLLRTRPRAALVPFPRDRPLEVRVPAGACDGYTGAVEMPAGGTPGRVAREGRDRPHWMLCRGYAWLSPGQYVAAFDLACSNVPPDRPAVVDVVLVGTDRVLAQTRVSGTDGPSSCDLRFAMPRPGRVEVRVRYGGAGCVRAGDIRIRELSATGP